ncbi:hypothetical protein [Flavobacterium sp. J27]|uniref:hypothetical protein n=1 Tax=Flavobacterium sp. J27 TaxID=2060419 RepID=UPI00103207B8|nr:hypothetical protein [Flavobacterium sp. J27]
MLKNIQKQLLLKYPLLWNTKFIPMLSIGVIFHLLYFTLGYIDGTIDFSNQNNITIETFSILFGILFCIVTIILWLVFYFKNNALKSFYKKSKEAVFYEWLQIFIICLLLTSFYLPFHFGKQLHQKSYFSLEETKNRCRMISNADFFIDGSFRGTEIDSLASGLIDSLGNKVKIYDEDNDYYRREDIVYFEFIQFKDKKYDKYSLLNRNIFPFTINTTKEDSIQRIMVQNWLHTNDKLAVKNLMSNYLKMVNEHHLKTNLTLEKWFEVTYNNPDFKKFLYIKPYWEEYNEYEPYNEYEELDLQPYNRYDNSKYSKFYVQQNVLKEKYDIISDAHTNPYFINEMLLTFLYIALGLSILIFSFRVASGKSWLIALVIFGILNIIAGFGSITIGYFYRYSIKEEVVYIIICLFFILFFLVYYFTRTHIYKKKKYTEIALILVLWSYTFIIPFIYLCILGYFKKKYELNEFNERVRPLLYYTLKDNFELMLLLNFIISVLTLFIFSYSIRKWKGLSEE